MQPSGVAGEPACDVQEPVAQPLRLAAGELGVCEEEPEDVPFVVELRDGGPGLTVRQ